MPTDDFSPLPPLDPAPWPRLLTPPEELLAWLSRDRQRLTNNGDARLARHVNTLRWLVLAELGRSVPEARERGPPGAGTVTLTSPVVQLRTSQFFPLSGRTWVLLFSG